MKIHIEQYNSYACMYYLFSLLNTPQIVKVTPTRSRYSH